MKSSTRNIVIVAVAAAVLGGVAIALTHTPGGKGTTSSAAGSSSVASIKLISKSSADVASMKVTNKKGSYTLIPVPSGKIGASSTAPSALPSSSGSSVTYTVEELSGCPVDTGETGSAVKNGFSLSATKNIGAVSSLEDYGLQDPLATVQVTFHDGSTFSYKIGNATATDSSAHYMCGISSNSVYIVSIDQGLLEGADYFISKEIVSSSNASSSDFTKIALSGSNFPTPLTLQKDKSGTLAITAPDAYKADATSLNSLMTTLSSITAESVVKVKPDAAALKQYGLSSPTTVAEYTIGNKSYKLIVGVKSGSNYYAMIGGVDVVYSVTAENLSGLVSQSMFSLRSKLVFQPDIETVKDLSIVSGNTSYTVNLARKENSSSSTQGGKSYTYKVTGNGGKALDYSSNYTNLYQKLTGLMIYDASSTKPSGSPAVTVKYGYFDKAGTDTVEFYLTSGHYTAVLNGKVLGLCSKSDLDAIMQSASDFETGKTVSA
ncbi:MAG TPA: hypothetical protein DG942_00090 [Ruminococcaceae bacterium]|jgi:hypothetical protein|nr:hypothetical protein [Oscillospiraceae bacterium]